MAAVSSVLSFKAQGRPLESSGLAWLLGVETPERFNPFSGRNKTPPPSSQVKPEKVDGRSMPAVLAWVQGIFAVRPQKGSEPLPRFVLAELDKRRRGWYTLRAYTSLKVARYLVSRDVKRTALFQSIWCSSYQRLLRHPCTEFLGFVKRLGELPQRPLAARPAKRGAVRERAKPVLTDFDLECLEIEAQPVELFTADEIASMMQDLGNCESSDSEGEEGYD